MSEKVAGSSNRPAAHFPRWGASSVFEAMSLAKASAAFDLMMRQTSLRAIVISSLSPIFESNSLAWCCWASESLPPLSILLISSLAEETLASRLSNSAERTTLLQIVIGLNSPIRSKVFWWVIKEVAERLSSLSAFDGASELFWTFFFGWVLAFPFAARLLPDLQGASSSLTSCFLPKLLESLEDPSSESPLPFPASLRASSCWSARSTSSWAKSLEYHPKFLKS